MARWPIKLSPNRNMGNDPRYIILHGSGGPEAGSESWIGDPASRVSYHLFIGKGDHGFSDITQFVPFQEAAWHAGRSRWGSLTNLNAFSIGIGLESMNRADEQYPDNQIELCKRLCLLLMEQLSIPAWNVLTHKMISDPPGRKTDPVNFPYDDFLRSLMHPNEDMNQIGPLLEQFEGLRHFDVAANGSDIYRGRIDRARVVGDKLYIRHAPPTERES